MWGSPPGDELELAGRTCIVTGASRGLGERIALALARAGANVVLAARSGPDLERVAARLEALGAQVMAVAGDITDPDHQAEVVARTVARFGRIDILVNNAGIQNLSSFERLALDEIARIVNVNLVASLQLTRRVLPGMLARQSGHVVNVASMAGTIGTPYNVVYSATKAGQIAATHGLRAEHQGTGVVFSVVCPIFVKQVGMWHDGAEEKSVYARGLIGAVSPRQVVAAIMKAIRTGSPEIYVTPLPLRPLLVVGAASPRLRERALRLIGVTRLYRRAAEANQAARNGAAGGPAPK